MADRINGQVVLVGKPDFLRNEGVHDVAAFESSAIEFRNESKTSLFMAIDGKAAGILTVADTNKDTAPHAIPELWVSRSE